MARMLKDYKNHYTDNKADFIHFGGKDLDYLINFINKTDYPLYIIDPLSAFATGERWGGLEKDNGLAAELLSILNDITANKKTSSGEQTTIIYTHHESQNAESIKSASRGVTALIDNSRFSLSLNKLTDEQPRIGENRFIKEFSHKPKIKTFQSLLKQDIGTNNTRYDFAQQNFIDVIRIYCHKNNYGKVGDSSLYFLITPENGEGLDIVRADYYKSKITSLLIEAFPPKKKKSKNGDTQEPEDNKTADKGYSHYSGKPEEMINQTFKM